jgi:hypothetical protein
VQFGTAVGLIGDFQTIRLVHFGAMVGFLAFIPGHLLMVALHGWNTFVSMLTGWKKAPDYLDDPSPRSRSRRGGPARRSPAHRRTLRRSAQR